MKKSEILLEEAFQLLNKDSIKEAVEKANESLKLCKSFKAYIIITNGLTKLNEYDKCLECIEEAKSFVSSSSFTHEVQDQLFKLNLAKTKVLEHKKDLEKSRNTLLELMKNGYKTDKIKEYLSGFDNILNKSQDLKDFERLNSLKISNPNEKFYIVESVWLENWKKYNLKKIEKHPGDIINESLVKKLDEKFIEIDEWEETKYILKPGLFEGKDFEIVHEKAYEILTRNSKTDYQIIRFSYARNKNEYQVEIYFPLIKLKFFGLNKQDPPEYIYVSKKRVVSEIKEAIAYKLSGDLDTSFTESNSQIWKFDEYQSPLKLDNSLKKIYLPSASLLLEYKTLEENKVSPSNILIVEFQRDNGYWAIIKDSPQICNYCKTSDSEKLMQCSWCKLVKYCSKTCQKNDQNNHSKLCSRNSVISGAFSKKGQVGLQNLGNTCFMNSGLQCLSHCAPLTEYFLQGSYKRDLNFNNPLGTKNADLAQKYADLITQLWKGSSNTVSPWEFKSCLSRFAGQFLGYQQHDSQEFLNFLLSGLHEDLNRVTTKVYKETPEQGNMNDLEYANEMWSWFLIRNQSIIIDLMYGQHKSIVICPQCERKSVTFDPFLTLSATIPEKSPAVVNVLIQWRDIQKKQTQVRVEISKYEVVGKLKEKLQDKYKRRFVGISINKLKFFSFLDDSNLVADLKSTVLIFAEEPDNIEEYLVVPVNFTKAGETGKYSTTKTHCGLPRMIFVRKTADSLSLFEQTRELLSIVYTDTKVPLPSSFEVHQESPIFTIFSVKTRKLCQLCNSKCEGCRIPLSPELTISALQDIYLKLDEPFAIEAELISKVVLTSFNSSKELESLQLYEKAKNDLNSCLKLAARPEQLDEDNKWYCSNCKDHVRATKQMQVYKFPKILIVHILRFKKKGYWTEKNDEFVDFPVDQLVLDSISEQEVAFNLFAISNHYGGTGGGHYTAYVKNEGRWYEMDDARVSATFEQKIVTNSAYLLFYERVN